MKHYPVENVYLYTSRHFPLVPIQKSCALCDNCIVYSISLVSNNYRGSNNCSVENNFHFRSECLVSYCSSVKTTVCMKHYPVENVYLYTTRHFPLVPIQKSSALFDNCLVYSISLFSNNYLGLNNCPAENNFHLLVKVLFPLLFCLDYSLYETLSSWECLSLQCTSHSPWFLFRKAVLCAITVLYTVPL